MGRSGDAWGVAEHNQGQYRSASEGRRGRENGASRQEGARVQPGIFASFFTSAVSVMGAGGEKVPVSSEGAPAWSSWLRNASHSAPSCTTWYTGRSTAPACPAAVCRSMPRARPSARPSASLAGRKPERIRICSQLLAAASPNGLSNPRAQAHGGGPQQWDGAGRRGRGGTRGRGDVRRLAHGAHAWGDGGTRWPQCVWEDGMRVALLGLLAHEQPHHLHVVVRQPVLVVFLVIRVLPGQARGRSQLCPPRPPGGSGADGKNTYLRWARGARSSATQQRFSSPLRAAHRGPATPLAARHFRPAGGYAALPRRRDRAATAAPRSARTTPPGSSPATADTR